MKHALITTALKSGAALLLATASLSAASQPVLDPAALDTLLAAPDIRVIDIRPPADYGQGHIPGALSAPYGSWRGPAHSPGQLPPLTRLAEQVQQLGLDRGSHAVVVSSGADTTDFGAAARVYWTLKYLGLENLSVLNGGMQAWQEAALPLEQAAASVTPSHYEPVLNTAILATQSDVQAQIGNPDARLVDARPKNFFLGQVKAPTAATPGTIHGAVNVEHSLWFEPGTTRVVSQEQAREIAARQFPEMVDDTIAFCNTGHWAATDWFALSELAGLPNVRMYPESLADWTNAAAPLPMDNEPGRGSQISNKIKSLFN
ncbi:sulfurtransferase [Kerstersia sp.]|uniref:sulfurtransferase n=1 Tax=Kerstersia sp. TaxID=1930783 RepID=UPI003F93DE34